MGVSSASDTREQDKGTKWAEAVGESCCAQVKEQKPRCDAQFSGCLLLEPQLTCKSSAQRPGHVLECWAWYFNARP